MNFHLQFGEMKLTLDDVSYLLHLPIDDMLLSHESMTRAETKKMMGEHFEADPGDTLKEMTDTKEGHA